MTSKLTRGPLFAEVHNVPDDYHFTAEELDRIIAGDMFTPRQGAIMARELQERRKAAMDSEPAPECEQLAIENFSSAMEGIGHIRRTLEETFGGLHGTHVEPDVLMDCKTICDAIHAAYSGNSPVIPDGYVMVPKEPTADMLAAAKEWTGLTSTAEVVYIKMLEAAPQPQNAQQNIPEIIPGWTPVSERTPESNKFVLVSNGVWVGQGLYNNAEYFEDDERWQDEHHEFINLIHHPVTHWMPLPAAPQEVNNG